MHIKDYRTKLHRQTVSRQSSHNRVTSIPSKYETIYLQNSYSSNGLNNNSASPYAFGSSSNRFDLQFDKQISAQMGPGCYFHLKPFEPKSDSFSHKGYTGGFISKTKRFRTSKQILSTKNLGPGMYYKPTDYTDVKNHASHGSGIFFKQPRWNHNDTNINDDQLTHDNDTKKRKYKPPATASTTMTTRQTNMDGSIESNYLSPSKQGTSISRHYMHSKWKNKRPSSSFASKTKRFQDSTWNTASHSNIGNNNEIDDNNQNQDTLNKIPRFSEIHMMNSKDMIQQSLIQKEKNAPFNTSSARLKIENKNNNNNNSNDSLMQELTNRHLTPSIKNDLKYIEKITSMPISYRISTANPKKHRNRNNVNLQPQRPQTAINISSLDYDTSIHETFDSRF